MSKPKLLALVGANASGKSALGLALAERFGGEILSADSRQIYRGFDLCCGKVTPSERARVPHHMLDLREVGQPYSVAEYQTECYRLIPEIAARGHLPMIVGGTGLYVASVVHGYAMMQGEPDETLRRELEEKTLEQLYPLLPADELARLQANPSDYRNKRRLIRCIEKSRAPRSETVNEPRFEVLQLGLRWSTEELAARIDKRLENRLQQGMIDEVRDYMAHGGEAGVMDALGLEYRHILWYLQGRYQSEAELKEGLGRAIRQFAKRQMTWFRREPDICWLDGGSDYAARAAELVDEFLK